MKHAFDSLFRTMAKSSVIIGYALLMFVLYQYVDRPLAVAIHATHWGGCLVWLTYLTFFGKSVIYLVLLPVVALVFQGFGRRTEAMRSWFLWCCVLFSNVICGVLKVLLGRARPDVWFSDGLYGFYGYHTDSAYWSFPSGHVTTITSLLFGFMVLFPRYRWVYGIVGLIMMASRILLLQHYMSDVWVAAYLALLEVGIVWWFWRRYNLDRF